jgi:hypothetical protein
MSRNRRQISETVQLKAYCGGRAPQLAARQVMSPLPRGSDRMRFGLNKPFLVASDHLKSDGWGIKWV